MENILRQPYSSKDYADFAVFANETHRRIEDFNGDKYALLDSEVLQDGVITDISNTPEYIAEQQAKQAEIQNKKTITKRQLLFWLFLNKQKTETDILNAIEAIQDPSQRYLGQVSYNGTNNFEYGNPFVPVIGQALGLTTTELIKCFDEAKEM